MTDTMEEAAVEWSAPPPIVRRGAGRQGTDVWLKRLAPFRDNPGKWGALPGSWPMNTPGYLRSGKAYGINPEHYEFTGRSIEGPDKRVRVWVRFVGENGEFKEEEFPKEDFSAKETAEA